MAESLTATAFLLAYGFPLAVLNCIVIVALYLFEKRTSVAHVSFKRELFNIIKIQVAAKIGQFLFAWRLEILKHTTGDKQVQ